MLCLYELCPKGEPYLQYSMFAQQLLGPWRSFLIHKDKLPESITE